MFSYSLTSYADCITLNGKFYCNNDAPLNLFPQSNNSYIPAVPYYSAPVIQQPQVIIVPQVKQGNPNFEKFEYDTGRVFKRDKND